jgi:hypothetical protein
MKIFPITLCSFLILSILLLDSMADAERGKYIGTAQVEPPWGKTYPHDIDGRVPEYLVKNIQGSAIGRAQGQSTRNGMQWYIRYERSWWKNNPHCRAEARRHERGHARGWGHYERPRSKNPAYDPVFTC